jgi:hypothetical protein
MANAVLYTEGKRSPREARASAATAGDRPLAISFACLVPQRCENVERIGEDAPQMDLRARRRLQFGTF